MKLDLNTGSIWTMITGIALTIVYAFNSFVGADENDKFHVLIAAANDQYHETQEQSTSEFRTDIYYSQFYELLEKREAALRNGNTEFANELARQMERLKAKICKQDPDWERCDD